MIFYDVWQRFLTQKYFLSKPTLTWHLALICFGQSGEAFTVKGNTDTHKRTHARTHARTHTHTIMDKIFETKPSFHVKWDITGKVQLLFFKSFLASYKKRSFCEEEWALGYNSMRFWDLLLLTLLLVSKLANSLTKVPIKWNSTGLWRLIWSSSQNFGDCNI